MMGRVRATLRNFLVKITDRAHDRHCPCPFPEYEGNDDTIPVRLSPARHYVNGQICAGCWVCESGANAGP